MVLLIGLSAGAIVVVLALVAAFVVPRVLEDDDFRTGRSIATSPQLVQSWIFDDGTSLLGLASDFNLTDDGLMLIRRGGVYSIEGLDTKRTLWTTAFPGACQLGTRGVLTCVESSDTELKRGVTLFDLRSGEELHQFYLPENPVGFRPLPDGGLIMAVSDSGPRIRWIRIDDRGREQWRSILPEGNWTAPTPHGAALTTLRRDASGNRSIRIVRSLATGEPLPNVPDGTPVALLPGGEIQVGSNPALILNKEGHEKLNLPGSTTDDIRAASSRLHQTSHDGSVQAYMTEVNDVPTIWNDKGDALVRSQHIAAVCNGTILTIDPDTVSGLRSTRIGLDSRGDEVLRVDLPWEGFTPRPGCDGERFVEVTADRPSGFMVAYDRSGIIWETPAPGLLGHLAAEGIIIRDGDLNASPLYLFR